MAKEIVNAIGADQFYGEINDKYPNAPKCKILKRVQNVENFLMGYFNKLGESIELHNLKFDMGAGICGMYVKKGNLHYIMINKRLNVCWNRFTRLKELCSMYVGHYQDDDITGDIITSLDNADLQKHYINNEKTKLEEGDLESDTFAILLACELMIPIDGRRQILDYFQRIEKGELTFNDLAKALLMPEYFLKLYYERGLIKIEPHWL